MRLHLVRHMDMLIDSRQCRQPCKTRYLPTSFFSQFDGNKNLPWFRPSLRRVNNTFG